MSDGLGSRGVDCLRFDYGAWDRGRGERVDATAVVEWARERYDSVALFGYSFGAGVALAAAARGANVDAVAAVAPPASLGSQESRDSETAASSGTVETDVVAELREVPPDLRVGVFYGTRDHVVDADAVAAVARESGHTVTEFDAGHFFVSRETAVASAVVAFLLDQADASR
ncbi:AcvB/VirJ family lysyl-phosphatidylglycerol hydrolase [Halobellus sp.]|uniref:AcvB/VirJ family lysyl-phosphatidylglycerol hydrolase n=1 Tax=Halobellus sp. TaxID=1979212 RepID=UPI0038602555